MPIPHPRILAATLALSAFSGAALAAEPELALKRVMLSTGGVGYFEYEATVSGDADLSLAIRRDRIDDVMKSIVVYDDHGGIGTINLPGREPLQELFRELPVGPEALESPQALLTALRGVEVRIAGPREITGRLVAVTEEQTQLAANAGTITRHRLSLMTGDGLHQAVLEDIESLRLTDTKLQAQLDTALKSIAQRGERDRRTLTLHTTGKGDRTVRVAYVIEAPLWKTAYRLTMDSGVAKSGLQGWAVLENVSGEDWNGVDLTVVSGNPVTFRQALYDAYYVKRPEIPVEVLGRVLPRVDEGVVPQAPGRPMAMAPEMMLRKSAAARALSLADVESTSAGGPPPPPAPAPLAPPPGRFAEVTAAESSEATTQVSFHHPGPVSVGNGQSLLLPIVNRAVPAERIALYQPSTQPRHPLATVKMSNDGASGLPPGILTLYERATDGVVSYVGDARLAALPSGQDRLLSFAVDQNVTVDRQDEQSQTLSKGRIVDGLLQIMITERAVTTYTIAGAPRDARRVVIEHPRHAGWELVPAAAGAPTVEATAEAYRLAVDVPAGKTVAIAVTTERPRHERFELVGLTAQQVEFYAAARDLPTDLRQAVSKLAPLRAVVAEREQTVSRLETAQEELEKDQQRLRDNLQAVGQGSDIGRRYLSKLNQDEDRLEKVAKDLVTAHNAIDSARKDLADYVGKLKF